MPYIPDRERRERERRELARSDRRWFLAAMAVFGTSAALLLGAHALYRATGPHPALFRFVRRVTHVARRMFPR